MRISQTMVTSTAVECVPKNILLDEPDIGLPERADMEQSSVCTEDPSQDDYLIGKLRKRISHGNFSI